MKTFISSHKMLIMWRNYMSDGLFHMCKQLISDHLLLNGVEFIKNKRAFDPGHEVRDAWNTHWVTFTKDAIDQLMAFGFVVVEIVKDDAKRKYPRTVHPALINIQYDYETREYDMPSRDVLIFGGFGFEPVHGALTSLAAKVLPKLKYLSRLRDSCAFMEDKKVDPCYFAETIPTGNQQQAGVHFDYFADATDAGGAPAGGNAGANAAGGNQTDRNADRANYVNAMYDRNEDQINVLRQQQQLYDEQMDNVRTARGLSNIIQLPVGQKLVKTADYTGRADIVQIHKVVQEEVCSTLGVPRSLLIGDSMYRSDTEGVQELFRQTILWWQSKMEMIETELYQAIYFDSSKVKISKNIYAAKQRYQVKVHFPLSPFASTEELTFLYRAGVISWQRYSTGVLRNASLPVEVLEEPEQPLDEPVPKKRQRVSKSRLTM